MRVFASMKQFSTFCYERAVTSREAVMLSLYVAADNILERTKSSIGHEWELPPALSEYTQQERVAQGYSATDTLLRTGSLRDSYEVAHLGMVAGVGSPDRRALFHELGFRNARTGRDVPGRFPLAKAVNATTGANFALISAAVALGAGIRGGPSSSLLFPTLADSMASSSPAGYVIQSGA
jgi:hypothetical protein